LLMFSAAIADTLGPFGRTGECLPRATAGNHSKPGPRG